jgi:hypothetical protein
MNNKDYSFDFETSRTPNQCFKTLLDVRKWWTGLYGEEIEGSSEKINDEFSFTAGNGAHYTRQRLIELVANKKMVWQVTESNLSFLKNPDEWVGTKICFEIYQQEGKTQVSFIHQGLVPKIECYKGCAGAWTAYLENLAKLLN